MSDETERAWAAGLIDGEGCFSTHSADPRYPYPRLTITQSDPEVLVRFRQLFAVGSVRGPYDARASQRRSTWVYAATGALTVRRIYDAIAPYLSGPKRRQAEGVFQRYDDSKKQPELIGQKERAMEIGKDREGQEQRPDVKVVPPKQAPAKAPETKPIPAPATSPEREKVGV